MKTQFTISLLALSIPLKIDIVGNEHWVVPTKSTVMDPDGVSASSFLWIFDGGHWKVFFPSSLEGLDP